MIPTNRAAASSLLRSSTHVYSIPRTLLAADVSSSTKYARTLQTKASAIGAMSQPRMLVQPAVLRRRFATAIQNTLSSERKPHFDKILIANRGEIACRVIRTAKKLGIKTVAVYSEVDANSLHVLEADEAYCIGPAPSAESYLRMDKIIDTELDFELALYRLQAVHPGYGFLSENAKFAERLAEEGIVFIGPPSSAIVSMGSKSESKNIMSAAGVPCVPGYHGVNQDVNLLFAEAETIGYPVLIKAIHGGGGKGMRVVSSASQFKDALASAQRESLKSFGDADVLVEKYIERPRHIEVQVFADTLGNAVSLWERDCSVQRRNQKIIEEAPAPGLSPELRADLSAKAVAAAKAVNYVGAGTVEFIFDNDTEKNTRLQVEHPVTEMITGLDLVEWQLEVAAGNPLPLSQAQIPLVGHAFEARIYAENPRNDFLPDSGPLLYLDTPTPTHVFAPPIPSLPHNDSCSELDSVKRSPDTSTHVAPSMRLEQGFTQGAQIGVFYDPMIAKLVVHARDRTSALRALRRALEEYKVVGVSTNVEFLRMLAGNGAFINGEVETGFIKKHYEDLFPAVADPSAELLAQAALFIALREHPIQPTGLSTPWTTLSSRRFGGDVYERTISIQPDDASADPTRVSLKSTSPGRFSIAVHSATPKTFTGVSARLVSPTTLSTTLNGASTEITIVSQRPSPSHPASRATNTMERLHVFSASGTKTTLAIPPPAYLLSLGQDVLTSSKGALRAPMPSLVVEVKVSVGDRVEKGQPVVVLESMKTETVLRAEIAGVVNAVGCAKGEMVEEGRELVDIKEDEL
ncbi:carbamoyl-phosphate synthase L chain, ATP binding domain-containing protein [Suillus subluteus]|nr:carbamoyl-phosphate synthase L chain, ATP binding domain-containing protein [Suillus subluteus]